MYVGARSVLTESFSPRQIRCNSLLLNKLLGTLWSPTTDKPPDPPIPEVPLVHRDHLFKKKFTFLNKIKIAALCAISVQYLPHFQHCSLQNVHFLLLLLLVFRLNDIHLQFKASLEYHPSTTVLVISFCWTFANKYYIPFLILVVHVLQGIYLELFTCNKLVKSIV